MKKCLFCQTSFTPKSPKHLFCSEQHRDFYNKGKDWASYYKSLLTHSKSNRKKLSVEFLVELHEKQNGKCALSGVELTKITGKGQITTNASLDRIKAGKAYSKSNVRLVCNFANSFRGNLTDTELAWWCEQILNKVKYG